MKQAMLTHIICMLFLTTILMSVEASRMGLWPSKYRPYGVACTLIAVAGVAAVLFKCMQKYVLKKSFKKNIKIIDKLGLFTDNKELNDRVYWMFCSSCFFIVFLEIGLGQLINRFTISGYLKYLIKKLKSDKFSLWENLKKEKSIKEQMGTLWNWYEHHNQYYAGELEYIEHFARIYGELDDKDLCFYGNKKGIERYFKNIGKIPFTDQQVTFSLQNYYELMSWENSNWNTRTIYTLYHGPILQYGYNVVAL